MTLHHNHLEEKMKMLSPPQVLSPCPGLRGCWRNLWILLTHPHVSQQVWVSQSWLTLHHISTKKWSRQTSHFLIKHLRYMCSLNREVAATSMLISFLEWVSGVPALSGAWGRLAAAFSAYLCWLYLETQSWLSNHSRSVANFPSCHLVLCIPPPPLTWTPDSLPGGFISSCLEWLTLLTPRTQRGIDIYTLMKALGQDLRTVSQTSNWSFIISNCHWWCPPELLLDSGSGWKHGLFPHGAHSLREDRHCHSTRYSQRGWRAWWFRAPVSSHRVLGSNPNNATY